MSSTGCVSLARGPPFPAQLSQLRASYSSSGLVYVVISTYTWLRDEEAEHPENLLLVFGIALISVFFMYTSLLFVAIFYCKRRAAFTQADRAAEIPAQFSDCGNRKRPNRRPGKTREYNARSAL